MPKIIENLPASILEAANGVLLEQGFQDFSIRSVAKKLGIAPATIYNYYPSKASILEALVNQSWHSLMEAIDRETAQMEDPLAALRRIAEQMQQAMNPLFLHWITPEPGPMPPDHPSQQDILAKKEEIRMDLTRRIASVLQRCGQDPSHAPVLTDLLILCSHHRRWSIDDVVAAVGALQT